MSKLFSVLEQCYCMSDAPQDHYPDAKGICQYCQIKTILADTMRENERLWKIINLAETNINNAEKFIDAATKENERLREALVRISEDVLMDGGEAQVIAGDALESSKQSEAK